MYQTRFFRLTLLALLFSLTFSCQKDPTLVQPSQSGISLEEAKSFWNSNHSSTHSGGRKAEASFAGNAVKQVIWDLAQQIPGTKSGGPSYWIVPFTYTRPYSRGKTGYQALVFRRNTQQVIEMEVMEVIAEKSYLTTHSSVFGKNDFTGYIAHLNQDGEFLYGIRLESGKFSGWIINYHSPKENQGENKNARTANCGYQYAYSTGFNVTVVWVNAPCEYTPAPGAPYIDWERTLQYDYEQTQAMYEHLYCMDHYGLPCVEANQAVGAERYYKVDGLSLDPCPQGELHKMYFSAAHAGKITNVMDNFFENPRFVWIVKSGDLAAGTAGSTGAARGYVPATTREPATMSTVVTTIDRAFVSRCTDLALQVTLVHEMVHAHLEMEYKSNSAAFEATYPQFMPEYNSTFNTNDAHHNEMIRSYISEIAAYLEEYGKMNYYDLPTQFYQDLAWAGMTTYPAFNEKSEADKTRITNTIYAEQQERISPNGTRPRGRNYCD